jgi:hypothetical protein
MVTDMTSDIISRHGDASMRENFSNMRSEVWKKLIFYSFGIKKKKEKKNQKKKEQSNVGLEREFNDSVNPILRTAQYKLEDVDS